MTSLSEKILLAIMGLIVAILIVLGFEGLQNNTIFDIIYW